MNYKKLTLGIMFALVFLSASVFAYEKLSMVTHSTSSNSQDMSYSEDGITYSTLVDGVNDVGSDTFLQGESKPWFFKNNNTANRQVQYTYIISNTDTDLKYEFECSKTWQRYYIESGEDWGQGLVLKVRGFPLEESRFNINSILSFNATAGKTFDREVEVYQDEVDESIVWSVC